MRNRTKNKMKNKRKTRGGMNKVVETPGETPVPAPVEAQLENRGEQKLLEPLKIGNDMGSIVDKVNNIIDYLKKKNSESSLGTVNKNGEHQGSQAPGGALANEVLEPNATEENLSNGANGVPSIKA